VIISAAKYNAMINKVLSMFLRRDVAWLDASAQSDEPWYSEESDAVALRISDFNMWWLKLFVMSAVAFFSVTT